MESYKPISLKLTYAGLIVLALGIFTSVSFSALSHILLIGPGLFIFFKAIQKRNFEAPLHWWALVLLTVVCWLSVLANWSEIEEPFRHLLKTKYFIIALLSFFSFADLKESFLTSDRKELLLKLFLLATTVATISGLIGLWSGFNPLKFKHACHATRACGLYGMYMTYGYGISLFMVLLTGLITFRKRLEIKLHQNWLLLCWAINLLGLIFSFARGGWLGFLGAVPFLFYKDHKKTFTAIVAVCFLTLGGAFIFSNKVQDVFTKRQGSNQQRLDFFKAAYRAFEEKPMLGFGYRNFEANSKKIKKRHGIGSEFFGGHAHNNALEHLASTGALGFFAFIFFVLSWLRYTYKEPVLFAFVMSFSISGLFQYTFGDGENLFLILGIFSLF